MQEGRFGACLMTQPDLVARCVAAMREAVDVPVTVKTRIGVDDHDSYDFLAAFVAAVAGAGCETFIVHARKALLQGLSPHQNRTIPSLHYQVVHGLKVDFPHLVIVINGGIATLEEIAIQLTKVDGVMLGRKAIDDPCILARVQAQFLQGSGAAGAPDRAGVIRRMHAYACRQAGSGVRLHHVTRHMLGLYHGVAGARGWRRFISEQSCRSDASPDILLRSIEGLPQAGSP